MNFHQLLSEYLTEPFCFLFNIINCQEQLKTIQQTETRKNALPSSEFALCH